MKLNRNIRTNLKKRILEYIENDQLLKNLIVVLSKFDNVYIVGGFIRDILFEKVTRDIDFLYDGDLKLFLSDIAHIMKGDFKYNKRFLTGVLCIENRSFDFATTRCETYYAPGALPIVRYCPLEIDFKRRDFTINAIVWDIRNKILIDPLNGIKDIESGTLRLTYTNSFIDDPTRMLRGVRFAGKYFLEIDKETFRCYNKALKDGCLYNVSSNRLRKELDLIFMENSFINIKGLSDKLSLFTCSKKNSESTYKSIYKSVPRNKRYLFNRDYTVIEYMNDENIKRCYPKEYNRFKNIINFNKDDLYKIYKKYGEIDLLAYMIFEEYTKQDIYKTINKLRQVSKLKLNKMIERQNNKIAKNKYSAIMNKIVSLYLKGDLKNPNDVEHYISRMEVKDGKSDS